MRMTIIGGTMDELPDNDEGRDCLFGGLLD